MSQGPRTVFRETISLGSVGSLMGLTDRPVEYAGLRRYLLVPIGIT